MNAETEARFTALNSATSKSSEMEEQMKATRAALEADLNVKAEEE